MRLGDLADLSISSASMDRRPAVSTMSDVAAEAAGLVEAALRATVDRDRSAR